MLHILYILSENKYFVFQKHSSSTQKDKKKKS